jgi:hypothetical protein
MLIAALGASLGMPTKARGLMSMTLKTSLQWPIRQTKTNLQCCGYQLVQNVQQSSPTGSLAKGLLQEGTNWRADLIKVDQKCIMAMG